MSRFKYKLIRLLSDQHTFSGVEIYVASDDESDSISKLIVEALSIIQAFDPLRFRRLKQDLSGGIWAYPTDANVAQFNSEIFSCELHTEYLKGGIEAEKIAAALVHEATHARLWKAGIKYDEAIRVRVEKVCIRQEIVFAKKLNVGQSLIDEALAMIDALDPDYYSDSAFQNRRQIEKALTLKDALKLGVPLWLIRAIAMIAKIHRFTAKFWRQITNLLPRWTNGK